MCCIVPAFGGPRCATFHIDRFNASSFLFFFLSFFPAHSSSAHECPPPLLRPVHLQLSDADILALSVQAFQGRVGLTDAEVLTDLTHFLASRPICYEVTRTDIQEIARGLVVIPEYTLEVRKLRLACICPRYLPHLCGHASICLLSLPPPLFRYVLTRTVPSWLLCDCSVFVLSP